MATGAMRVSRFPDPGPAYEMGAQKLDEVLLWCNELGIPAVTLWVCSTENLKRSHAEVSAILGAVEAKIGSLAQDPSDSPATCAGQSRGPPQSPATRPWWPKSVRQKRQRLITTR